MTLLRNVILSLEREQLPIFKETINLVIDEYFRIKDTYSLEPKKLLSRDPVQLNLQESNSDQQIDGSDSETQNETLISTIICEQAKKLIEKEISANMKQFDIQKMMDEMQEQDFIEFGLH